MKSLLLNWTFLLGKEVLVVFLLIWFCSTETKAQNTSIDIDDIPVSTESILIHSNVIIGKDAFIMGRGNSNTGVGFSALNDLPAYNSTSFTAVGAYSHYSPSEEFAQDAIGKSAMYNHLDGFYNVAIGAESSSNVASFGQSVAVGAYAMQNNVDIDYIGIGYQESAIWITPQATYIGQNTSHSEEGTALGCYALEDNISSSNRPTALGAFALRSNLNGFYNTAMGFGAMYHNSGGDRNTANGCYGLYNNTEGYANTAIGYTTLYINTIGHYNTAIGKGALYNNAEADYNTAIGTASLNDNTSGEHNTASGSYALNNNTIGTSNTAKGAYALYTNSTGHFNTGYGALANVSSGNLFNGTAIGVSSIVNQNNKIRLGAPSVTIIEGEVKPISDGRFKTNVTEEVIGLDFIKELHPVVYNFDARKFQEFLIQDFPDSIQQEYLKQDFGPASNVRQSGFIAQEVEVALHNTGYDFNGLHVPENEKDNYSISYASFIPSLTKAIQEQQKQLADQLIEIEELHRVIASMIESNPKVEETSIGDKLEDGTPSDVIAYPNPNNGHFTINTGNIDMGVIEITNLLGVNVESLSLDEGVFEYELDLSGYSNGEYIIKISSSEKDITTKLILEK